LYEFPYSIKCPIPLRGSFSCLNFQFKLYLIFKKVAESLFRKSTSISDIPRTNLDPRQWVAELVEPGATARRLNRAHSTTRGTGEEHVRQDVSATLPTAVDPAL